MPTTIAELLLPEWTEDGWAAYSLPLGPKGLTWKPPPKRPVAVRAEGASIDKAFAALAEPEQIEGGWATVYFPVNGPMTYKAPTRRPSAAANADDRCEFTEVNAPSVKMQRLAKAALNLAVGELGLRGIMPAGRGISLGWFGLAVLPSDPVLTTDDSRLAGFMRPLGFTAWIRHTLGIGETIRTVAHEVRHFWQLHSAKASCPFADNRAACQRDADRYEDTFWARHGARLMRLTA